MFGSSLFGGFGSGFDDPFFEDMQETHRRHMNSMQSMFQDPFMSPMMGAGLGALEHGGMRNRAVQPHRSRNPMAMSPFGMMGMGSMFQDMNTMMGNMHRNMERMRNDPNTHCFSSSTVMSFSNTGEGTPQYYQATSSTKQAPGGVREVRKSVKDSRKGVEKMSIGHHIGERAHVIEKSKNTRTGDMEEKQDFLNIDDTDAQSFDHEWRHRTGAGAGRSAVHGGPRNRAPVSAITDGREYRHDREQRATRHRDYDQPGQSVHFNSSERTSDDAHPYQRRPTPARPKGPSKGGRQRENYDD